MEAEIGQVEYQESRQRILVTVRFSEQQPGGEWHTVAVSVFVDWTDSYAEIKEKATTLAREFLTRASASKPE